MVDVNVLLTLCCGQAFAIRASVLYRISRDMLASPSSKDYKQNSSQSNHLPQYMEDMDILNKTIEPPNVDRCDFSSEATIVN